MMTESQIAEKNTLESKLNSNQELTARENMILLYSDFHKDAYGIRPRGLNLYAFTTEELEADFARFEQVCADNRIEELAAEAEADNAFRALITNTIQMGAGDEATALRWIAEGEVEQYGYDYEHFLWSQGIAYSSYGKEIAKKIAPIWGKALMQLEKVA
jgi:hypothetical protein